MSTIPIDLFSDTVTRPTAEMRQAMSQAEVGDEQKDEDPTTNRLNERVAELLGKEAALFLPSGTMCNQIAIRYHCRQGDEIIADHTAHIIGYEAGGASGLSGASICPVRGTRGIFDADQLREAIRPDDPHHPRTGLVSIEQTANVAGGTIWPLDTLRAVATEAAGSGIPVHMDGARLLNAVVATDAAAAEYCAPFNSVWIDFSKGLGAPIGASIAGSRELIREARRYKQQFGGAMRQSGIVAAGALYALDHHVERLRTDHENARILYESLESVEGLECEAPETNMVFIDVSALERTAEELDRSFQEHGMRMCPIGPYRLRAVTHLDVSRSDIRKAVEIVRKVVEQRT